LSRITVRLALGVILVVCLGFDLAVAENQKRGKKKAGKTEDPYAEYVWPPPPDEARIKLESIFSERKDIEGGEGKLRSILIGSSPKSRYDQFQKPFGVAYDLQGRILVTDQVSGGLVRIDRDEARYDVLGTQGAVRLKTPMGLTVGPDDTIYVADVGLKAVLALGPEGDVKGLFGSSGELENPTDVAVSSDGSQLIVVDSWAHSVLTFDLATGSLLHSFGGEGTAQGKFKYPTSVAVGPEGFLYVVDQLNNRIQLFEDDGTFVDTFGEIGDSPGSFTRPKGIAVDEVGLIYIVDHAFNNVQLFDVDFTLLTFIGEGGDRPGAFLGASDVAVRGDEFAVVDQQGARLQVFRFVVPKDQ
jgi:DNA-binding beta-propeller fold protein YncE